jgi:ASC-1-like (ASCH) protein
MYSEYLTKLALKKKNEAGLRNDDNMDMEGQQEETKLVDNMEHDMEMDLKDPKSKTMKTGDKYIIRKLISFKITIPKIDEYVNKLDQIKIKEGTISGSNVNTGSMRSNSTMQNNGM